MHPQSAGAGALYDLIKARKVLIADSRAFTP
jgi:hypothetical protein